MGDSDGKRVRLLCGMPLKFTPFKYVVDIDCELPVDMPQFEWVPVINIEIKIALLSAWPLLLTMLNFNPSMDK